MTGGSRSRRGKPPSNTSRRERSPLSENGGDTVNQNDDTNSHMGKDDKISNLQSLNQVLLKQIKGLREEHDTFAKKEQEYRDAISESEKRVKEEIAKKEEECQAVIQERNNLEATILHLREQLTEESEVASKSWETEKDELISKLREEILQLRQQFGGELEAASRCRGAEKDELISKISEETSISLHGKIVEAETQVTNQLKEEFLKKEEEWQAEVSAAKESQKMLKEDIAKKEEECQAVISEKIKLEANILKLEEQVQAMTKEAEAAQTLWDVEKHKLISKLTEEASIVLHAKMEEVEQQVKDQLNEEFLMKEMHWKTEISHVKESQKILKEDITRKEEECQAAISEKNELLSNILQLKEQIHVMSENSVASQISWEAEISHVKESQKILKEAITRKEEECQAAISEKNKLQSNILQLEEQMHVMSENSVAAQISWEAQKNMLQAKILQLEKQMQVMSEKSVSAEISWEAEISHVKQSQKILKEDITRKEEECQAAISEKNKLQANILQLKEQMQVMSEKSLAAQISWEAQKGKFLSQVSVARKDTEEMRRSHEMLQKTWEGDKENLLSALSNAEEKALELSKQYEEAMCQLNQKYNELSIHSEFLKVQLDEYNDILVSMEDEQQSLTALSASYKERLDAFQIENSTLKQETHDLKEKVIDSDKQYLDLNQKFQDTENSLKQQGKQLQTDIECARSLLEIQSGRLEELTVENVGLKDGIQGLRSNLEEMQETHAKSVEEKELLTKKLQSLHTVFIKKCSELDEKELNLLKQNEEQRKMIESLGRDKIFLQSEKGFVEWRLEVVTKRCEEITEKELQSSGRVSELEDQASELHTMLAAARSAHDAVIAIKKGMNKQLGNLTVEKDELKNEIEVLTRSLQEMRENYSKLVEEKGLLTEEFQEKELHSTGRVLDLEDQVSVLQTEMAAARSAYDAISSELSKTKEDMTKLVNDFFQVKAEKEALDGNLILQISGNEALEQDLLSAKCSSSDLKTQVSELAKVKSRLEEENNSLRAEVAKLTLISEGQYNQDIPEQESSLDHFNRDVKCRDISPQKLKPKDQHLHSAEDKRQKKRHEWAAWVASAGAVAAAAFAAYLKLSK